MNANKILVVDDEQDLCEILQFNLESEGYDVTVAYSAEEALEKLTPDYSLILLDVMMKGISGYQLAHQLRSAGNPIPIIFLTARSAENDLLTGFSIGGDDYIAKPFSIKEVLARIKAILKRSKGEEAFALSGDQKQGLLLDDAGKCVRIGKQEIALTRKEYLILQMLLSSPDTYFSREQILARIWNGEAYVLERTVDVHIARLRKKIGLAGDHLQSKLGFGYCWKSK